MDRNEFTRRIIDREGLTLGDVPADIWFWWVTLTLAMVVYWYVRYRRNGILSFDVFFVFLYVYVPIVFMSIFAFSPLNEVSTGDWHWRYLGKLREAFYVSLAGAAAFLGTSLLAARTSGPPPGYRWVRRAVCDFWMRDQGLAVLLGLTALFGSTVVATAGFVQSREMVQEHTQFRPTAHVFNSLAVVAMTVTLVEGYRRRSPLLTAAGAAITLGMVGFGTRKITVGTMLYYAAMRLIHTRSRRVIFMGTLAVLTVLALITAALAVEALRNEELSGERMALAPVHFMFGNNLSELRDFAWILAGWDGDFLRGKTYISGLLAFIPSFILPDRTEFGWGRFSTHAAGLDGGVHPGLRPTVFAEAYFNFGLPGALLFGVFLGAFFGRVSAFADRALREGDPGERLVTLMLAFQYFEFVLRSQQTAGYFQGYVELGLLGAGLVGASLLRPPAAVPVGSEAWNIALAGAAEAK